MKYTLLALCMAIPIYVSAQQCSDAAGTSNRYYMQVKAVSVEENVCGITNGMVRGINVLDEFCPDCPEKWDHRSIYVAESALIYRCAIWGGTDCVQLNPPWYQHVQINDYVVLDYTFKYNMGENKVRISFQVIIVEAIR